MSLPKTYLITTLARYQTDFWIGVGRELRDRGFEAAFLSFDDRSSELLRKGGFTVFGPGVITDGANLNQAEFDAVTVRFGLTDLNYWLSHEKFVFGIHDTRALKARLLAYLRLADDGIARLLKEGPVTMVQEVGGFLSVLASFFAARHHGLDNWFIEPAFFRGRMFFYRNSFAAPRVSGTLPQCVSLPVAEYLANTLATQAIVVPLKDRHQYRSAASKVFNAKNARRLVEKVFDKYVHRRHMEFGHIGHHAATHLRMLRNSSSMKRFYTALSSVGPFVYYPLHVPGDMALTLRSPEYLDQLALIDFLCRSTPAGYRVAIKEHPAMIGALDAGRLGELLHRHDHLVVLPPATNNYDVLRAAGAIVSVNSKSGAEAALIGKRVLVLGDAFYTDSPIVERVDRLQDLPRRLSAALAAPAAPADADTVARYFELVWRRSLPGELYVPAKESVRTFTDSMINATSAG